MITNSLADRAFQSVARRASPDASGPTLDVPVSPGCPGSLPKARQALTTAGFVKIITKARRYIGRLLLRRTTELSQSTASTSKAMTTIKLGLDLPILGNPEQHIEVAKHVGRVALVGDDYIGMKPTMFVAPGDRVRVGQRLFEDKKNPGVLYTSPASGTVAAIHRGAKRKFESIEIEVDGDDRVEFEQAVVQTGIRYSEKPRAEAAIGAEKPTTRLIQPVRKPSAGWKSRLR